MKSDIKFLSIGSAHWDILGRTTKTMALYDDVPGQVIRVIGGVAGPIAAKLAKRGYHVDLVAYAGLDALGDALMAELARYNVSTKLMVRANDATDVYMGIEAENGLVAAIADARSLEDHSEDALAQIARVDADTHLIIDGNLSETALAGLANKPGFDPVSLTLIPASPGKMDRLRPFLHKPYARYFVNLREGNLLLGTHLTDSASVAAAIVAAGAQAAVVTDGANPAAYMTRGIGAPVVASPPRARVRRYTGAGDTLTASFIDAFYQDKTPKDTLEYALEATARFISKEDDHVSDPL